MDDIIKKRKLKLENPLSLEQSETLKDFLLEIYGIREVTLKNPSTILVTYDLTCFNFVSLEKKLEELSICLARNFLSRYINGWFVFSEENELANLKIVPFSCCQEPRRS